MVQNSTLLQVCWDAYAKADKEHQQMLKKATASQAERDYALDRKDAARNELNGVVKAIKEKSRLTLHTVEEAQIFARLLPTKFEDRGEPQQVAIGNVGNETKKKDVASVGSRQAKARG